MEINEHGVMVKAKPAWGNELRTMDTGHQASEKEHGTKGIGKQTWGHGHKAMDKEQCDEVRWL